MFKSKTQLLLEKNTQEAIFNNLQLGDIVRDVIDGSLSIVIHKENSIWISLLRLGGESYHFLDCADLSSLYKVHVFDRPNGFTIEELVETFKVRLNWAHTHHHSKIDNLTYVEILARLREYERI